jgi:serine/threonine protein kinase
MAELQAGDVIKTKSLLDVKIIGKLGEGGQGTVYEAECAGRRMALKWYFPNKIKNPKEFYRNIENNISKGSPANAFLWPEYITERRQGTFGYLMALRPDEYKDFSDFLLVRTRFKNVTALINAALNIVEGFMQLHRKGFNYQDLNDGNFFVNPENGDVLICDNDNVMGHGYYSGIAGKCRYMAPEIVVGKKQPDRLTDRYSLSVVLFLLLFGNHPLEGKATNPPCMTEELERKFYGENPVFMFDPDDYTNVPVRGIHTNAINRWPIYPQYVRGMFIEAFSKDVLQNVKPRIIEKHWLEMFIRLRSEIIVCGCGNEIFLSPALPVHCGGCNRTFNVPAYLKFQDYNVPLLPGVNLYRCHTQANSENFKEVTAEVILNKKEPGAMGLRNLSDAAWYYTGADDQQISKKKDEVIRIKSGIKIIFGNNAQAEIIGNQNNLL